MKILSAMMLCALVACGGGHKSTPTNTASSSSTTAAADTGKKCSEQMELSCPDGQIDQCAKERAESDAKIKKMEEDKSDGRRHRDGDGTRRRPDLGDDAQVRREVTTDR